MPANQTPSSRRFVHIDGIRIRIVSICFALVLSFTLYLSNQSSSTSSTNRCANPSAYFSTLILPLLPLLGNCAPSTPFSSSPSSGSSLGATTGTNAVAPPSNSALNAYTYCSVVWWGC